MTRLIKSANTINKQKMLQNAGILSYNPSSLLSSFNNQYGSIQPNNYTSLDILNKISNPIESSIPPATEVVMPKITSSIDTTSSTIAKAPVESKNMPFTMTSEDRRNNLFDKAINLEKDKFAFEKDMGIASGFFQGLGSTINAGLGIWGAIESAENAKKARELADEQIKNYKEQTEASREARQQRREELARLNKMRSNTKAQFNTQASVTRSY